MPDEAPADTRRRPWLLSGRQLRLVDSVRGGLVGSVGVMTNMESVDHGLELLDGLDVCLGQHTNI